MADSNNETTIKVLACRKVFTGRNTRGDTFSIFEVDAQDKTGALIRQQLRSFEPLPIGQQIDVTVAPFESQEWGKSYTVTLKNSQNPSNDGQWKELADVVKELSGTVVTIQQRLSGMQDRLDALQLRVTD